MVVLVYEHELLTNYLDYVAVVYTVNLWISHH